MGTSWGCGVGLKTEGHAAAKVTTSRLGGEQRYLSAASTDGCAAADRAGSTGTAAIRRHDFHRSTRLLCIVPQIVIDGMN